MQNYEQAVADCEAAINVDPNFTKAWFRRGLAEYERISNPGSAEKAIECFNKAVELDSEGTNADMRDLLNFATEELKEDNHVPVPAEKERFETMFSWMLENGANFDKLKVRYYAPDYRGVHAARDIKKGETILYVPKHEIITLEMAFASPIGSQMFARGHRQRLLSPKPSFLATYVM